MCAFDAKQTQFVFIVQQNVEKKKKERNDIL